MGAKTEMRYGSLSRFFQAITGLFIIFFLGVHLFAAHINFGHPVAFFNSVLLQLRDPWWFAFFLIFVYVITYHGINGLKNLIDDTSISVRAKRRIGIILYIIYFITIIYGTILTILVVQIPVPS